MSTSAAPLKILTLLNVAQSKPKRKTSRDWHSLAKKVKPNPISVPIEKVELESLQELDQEEEVGPEIEGSDSYEQHWSAETELVGKRSVEDLVALKWSKSSRKVSSIGAVSDMNVIGGKGTEESSATGIYNARLMIKLQEFMATSPQGAVTSLQESFLKTLSSYRDLFYPKITIDEHDQIRSSISLHAMNHVIKGRARVLKNNDYLARSAVPNSKLPPREIRDQGFTRPKVLILLPFRNSANIWINHLTTLSTADSVENKDRFNSEFSLPEGAVDKLVENSENYKPDHVDTFAGNIDDSFRLGVKITRKSIKLFSEFYSCDIIIASPLGLRTSIEKEKDFDFLSSIEVLVVDQMDTMLMQNWEHVQFVMDRLNKLPEEAHGCDFSRVKPWYLDGKSASLRQSILLSNYETPEMRSLYSKSLKNLAGKTKAETSYDGILDTVPRGIKQIFTKFEANDIYSEDDERFLHFTTKTLPMLMKSAVSSNQTIIFVPSYFDFVRVKRHMKKMDNISFTSISEYTPTPDVSRARGEFFSGRVSFLLLTERFHFFRRYRIRGAKTFVFYAPPEHSHYYSEILSFPFPKSPFDGEEEVDVTELSCQVVFSKFDLLRLERICSTEDGKKMVNSNESRFTFL